MLLKTESSCSESRCFEASVAEETDGEEINQSSQKVVDASRAIPK